MVGLDLNADSRRQDNGEPLAVRVKDVSRLPTSPLVTGFNLEAPAAGFGSDVFAFPIHGWVLGARSPAVSVELFSGGHLARSIPVNVSRPDVVRVFPEANTDMAGFFDAIGVTGLMQTFDLEVVATFADGSRQSIAMIRGEHDSLVPTALPGIRPILLTSLGRSGTTWMMRLLGGHPQIVVHDRYPYELDAAGYWSHMMRVLSDPADFAEATDPHALVADPSRVWRNPYHSHVVEHPELKLMLGRQYVRQLAAFCLRSIDDWYATMARAQGRPEVLYFAEKCGPTHVPVALWNLYPAAKEIFLVRDLRDMASSALAFNRKRGYSALGRLPDEDNERYFQRLRESGECLLASWLQRRDRAHLVYYEDLVRDPVRTVVRMLEYLELDATPQLVERMLDQSSSPTEEIEWHCTSPSLADSVGRWKREPRQLRDLLHAAYRGLLAQFGYSAETEPQPASDDSKPDSRPDNAS